MRSIVFVSLLALFAFAASPAYAAGAGDPVADGYGPSHFSVGLQIGADALASSGHAVAGFGMLIPVEYAFTVGPGALAIQSGFGLSAGEGGFVTIEIPFGARYKIKLPVKGLFVYPFLQIGPAFTAKPSGSVGGFLQVGAGAAYMVHRYVELIFQPLGLGAVFGSYGGTSGGVFYYTFRVGAQFHF
jgi:hypothetical protein